MIGSNSNRNVGRPQTTNQNGQKKSSNEPMVRVGPPARRAVGGGESGFAQAVQGHALTTYIGTDMAKLCACIVFVQD